LTRRRLIKWLTPGIGIKRWLVVMLGGVLLVAVGTADTLLNIMSPYHHDIPLRPTIVPDLLAIGIGFFIVGVGGLYLARNLIAPYRRHHSTDVVDVMVDQMRRKRGDKFVAIGGGTGLPAALRGMKHRTGHITAVVTVADDGGSSGRLRREMGIAPPGDLRNNIAALADDDNLMTRLFQYRFQTGELQGHAFGNLFIAALASIVGESNHRSNLATALTEVERILNIRGRVLPATLDDVTLIAQMRLNNGEMIKVHGESKVEKVEGHIERIEIDPPNVTAYPESVKAIEEADIIVLGPGSLYTSILPNLMVKGIAQALRATRAYKIYICNVAMQPAETAGYTVADHVLALERHIGRGVFQMVLANNNFPTKNADEHTHYVRAADENHEILQRYQVHYTDLVDDERPWRHDPYKLAAAIQELVSK
jgi:uncharacterized cofD-like protein